VPLRETTGQGKPANVADGGPAGEQNLANLTKSVELVFQVKKGDNSALNELFRRYLPRLRRVVRIKMGPRLRQCLDPDDLVQETYMVAMSKVSELEIRSQASIMQWLTKIAEYQIRNKISYIQAQKRDPSRERHIRTGDPPSADSHISGVVVQHEGPTPSQILSRSELEELIDACVERLEPQDYREVILLRDYYGSDWEVIREQMDRPTVEAARELHRRAHGKLREKMRKYGVV
jgi:RNA polymerase sigma-70 factor (subfamily 1)